MKIGHSDVVLVVAFETAEQMDEVLSIYAMDAGVQEHNTLKEWAINRALTYPTMVFNKRNIPWDRNHEEAQAVEAVIDVARTFMAHREFEFGAYFLRFGKEPEDIMDALYGNSITISAFARSSVQFNRSIEVNI